MIAFQRAPDLLHLVCSPPRSRDHLSDSSHCLRIATHHRDGAGIVQDIFSGDRLGTNTRIGKRNIFGNGFIEVVADHEHL